MHEILHIYLIDYVPFIILLWTLFTIAGGIFVRGQPARLAGGQRVLILGIGTLLASWIGTTGAAMLLIRPAAPRQRVTRLHGAHTVVFFIFLVANIGGALTPLGDPPLFLGFLHGVPFFWTFKLLPETAFVTASCSASIFVWTPTCAKRKTVRRWARNPSRSNRGRAQLPLSRRRLGRRDRQRLLPAKLGEVTHAGRPPVGPEPPQGRRSHPDGRAFPVDHDQGDPRGKRVHLGPDPGGGLSLRRDLHDHHPRAGDPEGRRRRSARRPHPGRADAGALLLGRGLSVELPRQRADVPDLLQQPLGSFFPACPRPAAVPRLIAEQVPYLAAISAGAVFMGANTYIGNAPNFMVKSIAEEAGVEMPSFFGYMFKYSIPS